MQVMFRIICFVFTLIIAIRCTEAAESSSGGEQRLSRVKRVLPFLQGSGNGYIMAVAIPLALGERHVFQAFNFEVHYGLADNNTFSATSLKHRWQGKSSDGKTDDAVEDKSGSEAPATSKSRKSSGNLLSRKNVYRILESNLYRAGMNGTACLLKTICQTAESSMFENNGVFGNIFHIVFTPSSSQSENIPGYFYRAEEKGHRNECADFQRHCPKSLVELVTKSLIKHII